MPAMVNEAICCQSGTGYGGNFSQTLMVDSNIGRPGTWMFRVDDEVTDFSCSANGKRTDPQS